METSNSAQSVDYTTQSININPQSTTTYTVTVSGGSCGTTGMVVVNIVPTPTLSDIMSNPTFVSPSSDTVKICNSNTPNNAVLWVTYANASSFQWYKDGQAINGATTPSYSASAPGSYFVIGSNANGCVDNSDTVSVVVEGTPNVVATALDPTTRCEGSTVRLQSNAQPNYKWQVSNTANGTYASATPSGTLTNTAQTFEVSTVTSGSYYRVVTTNACGTFGSNPIAVAITPAVVPSISSSTSPTVCPGDDKVLNVSNASNFNTFNWQATTNNFVGSRNNPSVSAKPFVNTTYTVITSDQNTCTASSQYAVTVRPVVKPILNGPGEFCSTSTFPLTTTSNYNTYKYAVAGNPTYSSTIGNTKTVNVSQPGFYTVTVQDANGCTSVSDAVQLTTVQPLATPTIVAGGTTTFCEGQSINLQSLTAMPSYTWYKDGSNFATSPSITASMSGTYTLTGSNSCGSTPMSAPVVINVFQNPIDPTIMANGPTSICKGQSVTLSPTSSYTQNAVNGTKYQWLMNGSAIPNATNPQYTTTLAGDYKLLVSTSNFCVSKISDAITIFVSNAAPQPYNIVTPSGTNSYTVCANTDASIYVPKESGVVYTWYEGTGNTVQQSGYDNTLVTHGDVPQSYYAVLSNGCGTILTNTVYKTIKAAPSPIADVIHPDKEALAPFDKIVCANNSVKAYTAFQPGVNYQWFRNSVPAGNSTNSPSYTITESAGTYVYTLKLTLQSTQCTINYADTLKLAFDAPISQPAINSAQTTACFGDLIVLSTPTMYGVNYQYFRDGQSTGSTSPSYTASQTGSYTVVATNVCGSSSSIVRELIFAPRPDVGQITASGPLRFCPNLAPLRLSVKNDNFQYQWTKNGNPIAGQTSNFIDVSSSGTYSVNVKVSGANCTSNSIIPVVVEALPQPVGTALTAAYNLPNQKTCNGDAVVITFADQANVKYDVFYNNGSNNPNGKFVETITTPTYLANQTGTYTIKFQNECGSVFATNNVPVTVVPQPITQVIELTPSTEDYVRSFDTNLGGDVITFCSNASLKLDVPSQATVSYEWQRAPINPVSNQFVPVANTKALTVTTEGRYRVKIYNDCGEITSSNIVNVNVSPAPNAVTVSAANNVFTACIGQTITLNASAATGTWYLNGFPTTEFSNTLDAVTEGTYYFVTGNTLCKARSNSVVLNFENKFTAGSFMLSSPTNNICDGASVTLEVSPARSDVSYEFFYNGQSITSPSPSATVVVSPPVGNAGANVYSVAVSNTCSRVTANSIARIQVVAYPMPPIIANKTGLHCEGSPISLIVGNLANGTSYQWFLSGPAGSTLYGTTTQLTTSVDGSYTLVAVSTANKNCATNGSSIEVKPYPVIVDAPLVSPNVATTFCNSVNTLLSVTNANGSVGQYIWFRNGGAAPSPNTGLNYVPQASGTYSVRAYPDPSAQCTYYKESAPVELTVANVPQVTISLSGKALIVDNPQAGLSYQWYLINASGTSTAIPGATNNAYSPSTTGLYYVVAKNTLGCTSQSKSIYYSNVGISDPSFAASLQVYPNPSAGEFNIQFNLSNAENVTVLVKNMQGQEVAKRSLGVVSQIKTNLDLSNLANGIYFMEVVTGNSGKATVKLSKQQ